MNKLKILLIYISSNRVWIITLACLDLFFIFLAWLANPDYFINYAALIIFVSFAALAIPLAISIRKRNKADAIFRRFLLEPDDTNEYLLCEAVPAVIRPLICELGKHLRTQQEYINEQKITVTDYEHYVENWVHEIKKPLSLMTCLLYTSSACLSNLYRPFPLDILHSFFPCCLCPERQQTARFPGTAYRSCSVCRSNCAYWNCTYGSQQN